MLKKFAKTQFSQNAPREAVHESTYHGVGNRVPLLLHKEPQSLGVRGPVTVHTFLNDGQHTFYTRQVRAPSWPPLKNPDPLRRQVLYFDVIMIVTAQVRMLTRCKIEKSKKSREKQRCPLPPSRNGASPTPHTPSNRFLLLSFLFRLLYTFHLFSSPTSFPNQFLLTASHSGGIASGYAW